MWLAFLFHHLPLLQTCSSLVKRWRVGGLLYKGHRTKCDYNKNKERALAGLGERKQEGPLGFFPSCVYSKLEQEGKLPLLCCTYRRFQRIFRAVGTQVEAAINPGTVLPGVGVGALSSDAL